MQGYYSYNNFASPFSGLFYWAGPLEVRTADEDARPLLNRRMAKGITPTASAGEQPLTIYLLTLCMLCRLSIKISEYAGTE